MLRFSLHYGIHFLVPILIGVLFFKQNTRNVILILLAGIMIDMDHLWATPIYDSTRCSIGFHLLHSYGFIGVYTVLLLFKKTRLWGIALLLHIFADWIDCLFIHS